MMPPWCLRQMKLLLQFKFFLPVYIWKVLYNNFLHYPFPAYLRDRKQTFFIVLVIIYLYEQHSRFVVITNIYFHRDGKIMLCYLCQLPIVNKKQPGRTTLALELRHPVLRKKNDIWDIYQILKDCHCGNLVSEKRKRICLPPWELLLQV